MFVKSVSTVTIDATNESGIATRLLQCRDPQVMGNLARRSAASGPHQLL
jgi:hypothetical protein